MKTNLCLLTLASCLLTLVIYGTVTKAYEAKVNNITADYYYFTHPNCAACQKQSPIVKALNKQGYDFKIREWGYKDFNITALPAFVTVVKENGTTAVTVKMENRIWTAFQLKILVRTVDMLARMS